VTLRRPEARNAINAEVVATLGRLVQQLEADPEIWVVVLTGAGGQAFSSGADLKEVAAGRIDSLWTAEGGFAGFVAADRTKPWIAAVDGFALAGGCELALACDMIVASEDASFGLPEVTRGLIPAAGGAYRLPRALPRALALRARQSRRAESADPLERAKSGGDYRSQRADRGPRKPRDCAEDIRPRRRYARPDVGGGAGPHHANRGLPGGPSSLHGEAVTALGRPMTGRTSLQEMPT
jgi:hypothetical protein